MHFSPKYFLGPWPLIFEGCGFRLIMGYYALSNLHSFDVFPKPVYVHLVVYFGLVIVALPRSKTLLPGLFIEIFITTKP